MLRFPGFGCLKRKISPKFHAKNGVKNGQFHADFTLLGRGAEKIRSENSGGNLKNSKSFCSAASLSSVLGPTV